MKQTKAHTIPEIQKIVQELATKYDVERVFLFGSYARGEETPESDVDLRVDMADSPTWSYFNFFSDLEEHLGISVDLVESDGMPDYLLEEVRKDEVKLFERTKK